MLGNTWVPEFVALNALAPLDSFAERSKDIRRDDFFPGIWKTNVVDGKTYGIPWYVDTRLIFYRTDLLAKAGYKEFPKTWAEWMNAMKKMKSQMSDKQFPMLMPTNEWPQPVIFGIEAGSPILRDGGRFGAFEQPAFRKGFDFYLRLLPAGIRITACRARRSRTCSRSSSAETSRCTCPAHGTSASSRAGSTPRPRTSG